MRSFALSFLCTLGLAHSLAAQIPEDPFFRMTFNQEKREVVEDFLNLTPEESAAFWPIYNEYERERQAQGSVRLRLVEGYLDRYPNISAEESDALVDAAIKLQEDMARIKKKYYRKMKKAVSSQRAMSWLQLEEYIMLSIRLELYDSIPFFKEDGS